ncbi:hypothetical protein [Polaribacter sp.]|uniref:hypothetical protein n=1 Tax=Polaribacter sp. TaxID=1920175 RepID=UPI003F6D3860
MKKYYFLLLSIFTIINFSSCKVSKEYVQFVTKKDDIKEPATKKVLVFSSNTVSVKEFKKTYAKNFKDDKGFSNKYIKDFSTVLRENKLFSNVVIDTITSNFNDLNKNKVDYIIHVSNVEIMNRVEWTQGAMNMNGVGMQAPTSTEYCVINVKVEVYNIQKDKEIIEFVAIGEESVFLFDFTKTFKKAKERSINHIINYLKSGRTTYDKY